jgi:hypothetical protein
MPVTPRNGASGEQENEQYEANQAKNLHTEIKINKKSPKNSKMSIFHKRIGESNAFSRKNQ